MDSPSAAFRASYPIDFQLYDQDHHYALYIDDNPSPHLLTVEFHNVSVQAIEFQNGQGEEASLNNYHFELQFKPGTLSSNTIDRLQDAQQKGQVLDSEEWDFFMPADLEVVDHLSLYLLYKGKSTTFQPDERRQLNLNQITAAAGDGTRGTRVTMKVNQLVYAGQTTPISHTRSHHLSIVNHQGRPNIPFHLSFVGSNRILNDGAAHPNLKLIVRLRNISPTETVPLTAVTVPRFSLSVDTGSLSDEWALCTPEDAHSILVRVSNGANWVEVPEATGNLAAIPEWHITADFLAQTQLAPHEWFDIELSNFITNHPTGMANLYLRFENMPGYWDEQTALSIEKAPLLFINGRVGIGTAEPEALLHLKGDAKIEGKITTDTHFRILVDYPWADYNRTLIKLEPNYKEDSNRSRVFIYAPNAYYTNEPAITLAGNYGGGSKVGIGTTEPEALLHFKGNAIVEGQITTDKEFKILVDHPWADYNRTLIKLEPNYKGDAYRTRVFLYAPNAYYTNEPAITLAGNYGGGSKVGIGTTEPEDMLHVQGDTRVTGDLRLEGDIYKKAGDWWYLPLEIPAVQKIWPAPPPVTAIDAIWRRPSDGRLKHQVRQIDQALTKIAKLRGITFEWNDTGLRHLTRAIETHVSAGPGATEQANQQAQAAARQVAYQALAGSNIGLVAQDVEQVLPELIDTDEAGYKNLRYDLVTALLVEAVKELKALVETAIGQPPELKGSL